MQQQRKPGTPNLNNNEGGQTLQKKGAIVPPPIDDVLKAVDEAEKDTAKAEEEPKKSMKSIFGGCGCW